MGKADHFVEAYKRLEADVRFVFHLKEEESIVTALKQSRQYARYRDKIQSCANLRNYYQHTEKLNNVFAAEPMDEAIEFINMLDEMVRNRQRCKDICIQINNVYWKRPEDSVRSAMQVMKTKMYTHIPILQNGIVTGVFDENSLFSYIADSDDEIFELDDKLTFADIETHCQLKNRDMEEFEFVSMNRYVDDVITLFEKRFANNKRLGLVLLTQSGKNTEPLQGILTPWDVIGRY